MYDTWLPEEPKSGKKEEPYDLEMMRYLSNLSGVVFDPQVQSLKIALMLISNSRVTISLDLVNRQGDVEVHGKISEKKKTQMDCKCRAILGNQWRFEIRGRSWWKNFWEKLNGR